MVGLRRVLVLKRLESSPVAFLITLLRLLALHAHRLNSSWSCVMSSVTRSVKKRLAAELDSLFGQVPAVECEHIDLLLTGGKSRVS